MKNSDKNTVKNPHILIIEARFYDELADAQLAGATHVLDAADATYEVVTVPGALEIPAAVCFAEQGAKHYDGYVVLGMVIRGETYHFDIVANESSRAIMDLTVQQNLCIGNGILTVENEDQAWARASREKLDKGGFAAKAALSMIALRNGFGDGQ